MYKCFRNGSITPRLPDQTSTQRVLVIRIEIPSTSSLANQEWEQETKDTEGMIPQLGNSNPVDSEDIHLDQVGSTMAELQTTSSVSIVPGRIDFSIATQLKTMITEVSYERFKKQVLAHFA